MNTRLRTHTCGQLRQTDIGKKVAVCGWLHSTRDLGAVAFFVLRDFYGVTQVTINAEPFLTQIRAISRESVLRVEGSVIARSSTNPDLPTGLIEIEPTKIEILGECIEQLPFEIPLSLTMREDARLKYRFLDMRNPVVKDKLVLRSQVASSIRRRMTDLGFLEVTTPILTSSSPEGARDFIVPSRLHHGQFYALPQAPQQFKQLLMTGGFDRYFQLAPCFRDEDARADRSPGEFYQLDLEMSFAGQEDVFEVIEAVFPPLFKEFSDKKVDTAPFLRISYDEAIEKYGCDKPDLRNPLLIQSADFFSTLSLKDGEKEFAALKQKTVKAIVVKEFDRPRSFIEKDIIEGAKSHEIDGLFWFKTDEKQEFVGGISKFLNPYKKQIFDSLQLQK
ncbi:MAG: OB-fold nucleic acid binding domain-containing protein, partial [Firmicutes bacterium]|nr:OB-fold nucleic acid binding domain-containing protein [Bacillota bacterium]